MAKLGNIFNKYSSVLLASEISLILLCFSLWCGNQFWLCISEPSVSHHISNSSIPISNWGQTTLIVQSGVIFYLSSHKFTQL